METEDNYCELELSSKVFKFRKHDVSLRIRKSWRLAHNLSEPDVFSALLSARCCLLGSDTEASCKRCKCSPVVVLSATSQHPSYDAETDTESYQCAIQSRCTSSRDHLKSSLVLVIDRLPLPNFITSGPFVLYARDKTKYKKESAEKQQPLSLFKRNRTEDMTSNNTCNGGVNTDTIPETHNKIEEQKQTLTSSSSSSEVKEGSNIPDCSSMLPEAFVSSFLLEKRNKRNQIEEDTKQPPEQRRHISDHLSESPEGVILSPTVSKPSSTTNSVQNHSDDVSDHSLFPEQDTSDLPSYFDSQFLSYPRGDNVFTGFSLLSPTLLDLPPYFVDNDL